MAPKYGVVADRLIGAMSRLIHVRGAKLDTVADLDRYAGLTPAEMFPAPPPVAGAEIRRTAFDRVAKSSTVSWTSGHRVLCPRYAIRHRADYRRNLTARMRWVRPDRTRREAILVYVHGWLEPGSWAEETTLFRKWSAELGVDLAHVALPFHGARKPPSALFSGEFFWTADLVRTVEGVRQAVCDVRAAVCWLREQGYSQVGVTGLSLGGAITMLVGCLEPSPDYIAPIIAHLQLGDVVERAPILWRMKRDLERWGYDEADRRALLASLGWHAYEPALPPERQLWIQARDDVYIDAELAVRQWRAWQRPEILWIEGGHMTFPFHIDAITRRIDSFRTGLRRKGRQSAIR